VPSSALIGFVQGRSDDCPQEHSAVLKAGALKRLSGVGASLREVADDKSDIAQFYDGCDWKIRGSACQPSDINEGGMQKNSKHWNVALSCAHPSRPAGSRAARGRSLKVVAGSAGVSETGQTTAGAGISLISILSLEMSGVMTAGITQSCPSTISSARWWRAWGSDESSARPHWSRSRYGHRRGGA
jgi:hypothetical protein